MQRDGYLILSNGTVFKGEMFGAEGQVTGELVFTTAMTGYLEALTDPGYYGQIVIQTFPLIGNYGVIPQDFESDKVHVKGYIVRQWCQVPSNFRCEGRLDTFLTQNGVVALSGIDTRELTRIVRKNGVMNARISTSPELTQQEKQELASYKIADAVKSVTCKTSRTVGEGKYRVVIWDLGAKKGIEESLIKRDCQVIYMPATSTAEDILALDPDGIMLSNGPGDPDDIPEIIAQVAKVADKKIPTMGICLGHLVLAKALGGKCIKMKYGHRGENQPVKDAFGERIYITAQSHGYAVDSDNLPKGGVVSFINVNDGTCEGIKYTDRPAFTLQFHPEACGGPLDTEFMFDNFIDMMKEGN